MGIVVRLCAVIVALTGLAQTAQADTRAQIIDAAWDTRPFVRQLAANGVEVVGRYLARCPQPERGIPQKRLIDQGSPRERSSEVNAILDAGMAILSIYQYNNDSKNKFVGRDRDGNPLPDASCQPTRTPRSPAQEARLDANAAVAQAGILGQPLGSAIYFGVDIAFSASDSATRDAMVQYFRTVRAILKRAGFRLGAYGNGDALEVLEREGLIEFGWLSASRAYPGTSRYHNSGRWHLFQNQVNRVWFSGEPGACQGGLPLDTNVKNERFAGTSLGFWNRRGVAKLSPRRVRQIFRSRRFACDGAAVIRRTAQSGPGETIAGQARCVGRRQRQHDKTIDYANSVRLGRRSGNLVEVDYDEDGKFDGWTVTSNLTPSFSTKPEWIFQTSRRRAARCP